MKSIEIDISFLFWLGLLFIGEPDLYDAIIYFLMK